MGHGYTQGYGACTWGMVWYGMGCGIWGIGYAVWGVGYAVWRVESAVLGVGCTCHLTRRPQYSALGAGACKVHPLQLGDSS